MVQESEENIREIMCLPVIDANLDLLLQVSRIDKGADGGLGSEGCASLAILWKPNLEVNNQ